MFGEGEGVFERGASPSPQATPRPKIPLNPPLKKGDNTFYIMSRLPFVKGELEKDFSHAKQQMILGGWVGIDN